MKYFKMSIALLLTIAFFTSCEKETTTLTDTAEIQTQLNDGKPSEKLQLYLAKLAAQKNKKGTAARIIDESNYKGELCGGTITEGVFENYPFYWGEEEEPEVFEPHLYTFNGTEGDEISIYIPRKVANLDPAFSIFDDSFETISDPLDGDYLISADDEVESEYGGCYEDPMIENFVLPYTGSYTLVVMMLSACEDPGDDEDQVDFNEGDIYPYEIHVTGIDSCDIDMDGDGVLNEDDPYPNSNLSESIYIGEEYLDIENVFVASGTTMMDQIDALIAEINEQYNGENWDELHRNFTRGIAKITYYWRKDRLITRRERSAISSAAWSAMIPYVDYD